MYFIASLALLECSFFFMSHFGGGDILPAAYYQALILVVLVFVGVMAYQSVEDDEFWHVLAYLVGSAYVIEHLVRRAADYDKLAESGTMLSTSLIAIGYIGLPIAVCILPFVAMLPRYRDFVSSRWRW